MTRIVFISIFFFLSILSGNAQIVVDDSTKIINLVKIHEGPGVKISNIVYHISPNSSHSPAGYFTDPFGVTGLEKGLLLTTGAALNAVGPNDVSDKSQGNSDSLQDPDMYNYVNPTNKMLDVCYVEFDFITSSSSLSFSYVFGSEEYVEFLNYPDQFAFLISGPGIAGKQNIALVPNTNLPVSVGNINPNNNSGYFISNGTGSTPFINLDLQYDGYTTVLKAHAAVLPCQTYHIKLAIADLRDDKYDSGVFIEQESFVSKDVNLKVEYEHPRFNTAMEGCNKAYIIFKRNPGASLSTAITYDYYIKGTATNSVDYGTIPSSITIPAGKDSAFITIDAFDDGIDDDAEFVRIVLKSPCPAIPLTDSIDVVIKEDFPYPIPDDKICLGQSVQLNKSYLPGDSIFWNSSPYLSCDTCLSPVASNPSTQYFGYLAKDPVSGCKTRDSVLVEVIDLKVQLSYYQDPCYSNLDFFFLGNSTNATNYNWDFGDNTSSQEANPLHQFPFLNTQDPVQYTVHLLVSREQPSCSADTTITIAISDPLFIPNLITVDDNGKNDNFEVLGINTECWRLDIYNRWNSLVYRNDNYQNNFNAEKLSEGVYYFLLQNHPKDRKFKGWIHILK
jgi:hypothetical protein